LEQRISLNEFLENFPGVSGEQADALESAALLFQSSNLKKIDEIIV
jgi:hypothetical protein